MEESEKKNRYTLWEIGRKTDRYRNTQTCIETYTETGILKDSGIMKGNVTLWRKKREKGEKGAV